MMAKGTTYQHQNIILMVKYSGGSIVIWAALLPLGLDSLPLSLREKFISNFTEVSYRKVVNQVNLSRVWVVWQDNDPKH